MAKPGLKNRLSNIPDLEINPKVRDVLTLLAGGTILAAFIVFPGLPLAFASQIKKREKEKYKKDWGKYDRNRLRQTCKRLKKQELVEIDERDGIEVVKLTEKGKIRTLKYKFEEMALRKDKIWDGKWRLVIYDIPESKKDAAEAFRQMLKRLECFPLQRSVYLTPYPCRDEIKYLREVFEIGESVLLLEVSELENEDFFRQYFKL